MRDCVGQMGNPGFCFAPSGLLAYTLLVERHHRRATAADEKKQASPPPHASGTGAIGTILVDAKIPVAAQRSTTASLEPGHRLLSRDS